MTNIYADLLKQFYDGLAKGNLPAMLEPCAPEVTFQVPGRSVLAGKHTREAIGPAYVERQRGLSDGTLKIELHDVLASEQHGLVLMTNTLVRGGVKHEYRTVHVWRFSKGRLLAGYEYARDLYQFDTIWA